MWTIFVAAHHMPFPIIFALKRFSPSPRIVAIRFLTMEFLLFDMTIVDVTLQVRLGSKSLAAVFVRALVLLAMIPLMMSIL